MVLILSPLTNLSCFLSTLPDKSLREFITPSICNLTSSLVGCSFHFLDVVKIYSLPSSTIYTLVPGIVTLGLRESLSTLLLTTIYVPFIYLDSVTIPFTVPGMNIPGTFIPARGNPPYKVMLNSNV